MGNARVEPSKPISIPRLELTAALISVDFATMLSKDLKYNDPVEVFCTDPSVVLSYIPNETKQDAFILTLEIVFSTYTTYPIHNSGTPNNPADITSRGISAKGLAKRDIWFKGPRFL